MPIVWYIQQLLSEHVDSMFVTVALDANDICLLRHLRLPLPWLWIGLLLGIGLGGLVQWHVYRGHHQQDAILSLYTARVRIRNASDASLLRIEIHSKVVLDCTLKVYWGLRSVQRFFGALKDALKVALSCTFKIGAHNLQLHTWANRNLSN